MKGRLIDCVVSNAGFRRKPHAAGAGPHPADTTIPKPKNTGLTRTELLVVIVAVILILSILMPALARVKSHAQEEIVCRANLRQVGLAIGMFLRENDFTMPNCHVISPRDHRKSNMHLWTSDGLRSSPRLESDEDNSYWGTAYNKYVKDIGIFRCPAIAPFSEMLTEGWFYMGPYGGMIDPSVRGGDIVETASFGLNGYIDRLNANSVQSQSEVIICTDHIEPRCEQADYAGHGDLFCIGADPKWNLSHYRAGTSVPDRTQFFKGIFRHNIRKDEDFETGGRASTLWLDGHVSTIEETTGENIPNRWYDPRGIDNGGWLDISQ